VAASLSSNTHRLLRLDAMCFTALGGGAMDIFGQPDWLGLAGGILGETITGIIEALNWFSILLPFFLAAMVRSYLKSKKVADWLAFFPVMLTFVSIIGVYYLAYPHLSFPLWMRWFH
jgi:hypothetical protein